MSGTTHGASHGASTGAPGEPPVSVRDEAKTRFIRLERPAKANALDAAMMRAIAEAVAGAARAGIELIVLSGSGDRGFCAGADIAEFSQGVERLEGQEHALLAMIDSLTSTPVPICVLARGKALGAGGILLTLADLVVASDDLSFGFPEIRFGMYPVIVHAALIYRLPESQAAQLCLSGRLLDAMEARALGLVTHIVPQAEFEARSAELVAFHRDRSAALRIAKRAFAAGEAGQRVRERARSIAPLMIENYQAPGVRARIEAVLRR